LFHWSGYGRIVIGSYIMMPVLIAAHHRRFVIRIWHTAVAAPPALSLAIISRGGEGLGNVGTGGAAHHLQLTTEVLASSHHLSSRWGEYFEQWLLFFLNWMPREWWPEKPLGVGSTFVDDWIGRAGFAANHSVSVGYIGESVYFLGPISPVGILIALLTLVVVRRMIQKFVIPAFSAVIAYDVMLISYVWGGYATFGSRAWFFIVPMAAWALLQK